MGETEIHAKQHVESIFFKYALPIINNALY